MPVNGCATKSSSSLQGSPSPTASKPSASPSTAQGSSAPPSIDITSPTSAAHCFKPTPQCQFEVTGEATGAFPRGLEILVLVYPISPSGTGWYIQWPPVTPSSNGAWLQSPTDIGSDGAAAHNGDTLQIVAVLVGKDASYNRTSLQQLSQAGMPIPDCSLITGLVNQSAPVSLTVRR
jgi:hypothetical protein